MSGAPFDPAAWAASRGVSAGEPRRLAEPEVAVAGEIEIDRRSLAVRVPRRMAAVAVESRLREQGLTLGLFPERYEVASVEALADANDPGAGASGAGFGSLVLDRDPATLLLAVRPRPEAQAGRAFRCDDLAAAAEFLRKAAQEGVLTEIAFAADAVAAELVLRVAQDPDGARYQLGPSAALLVLIASGHHGEAAARLDEVAGTLGDGIEDLGQNVARAWAQSRYDLAMHARVLASAGYRLETRWAWQPWSGVAAAHDADRSAPDYAGTELLGAGPHGATLLTRWLSAEGERRDTQRDQAGAGEARPGDPLTEEARGEPGGDDDARLAHGGHGPG
jgi:hypothetical protein